MTKSLYLNYLQKQLDINELSSTYAAALVKHARADVYMRSFTSNDIECVYHAVLAIFQLNDMTPPHAPFQMNVS